MVKTKSLKEKVEERIALIEAYLLETDVVKKKEIYMKIKEARNG